MDNKHENNVDNMKSTIEIINLDDINHKQYANFFKDIDREAIEYKEHPKSINNIQNKQLDHFNEQIKQTLLTE